MNKKSWLIIIFVVLMGLSACSDQEQTGQNIKEPEKKEQPVISLMTHDSFSISKTILEAMESTLGAKVVILKSGDAGEVLNKAILSKNNPLADIIYGVDNTFLSRALNADMLVPYSPKGLENVSGDLKLDDQNRMIPVDFGDVCLNYDISWFDQNKLTPPDSLEDLLKPELKGLTVIQNPSTSSPGLAFLLATISRFGESEYLDYWKSLKANDVLITNGWKEAYWGEFTAASDGKRPIVVSYASSPAAEVFFAKERPEKAPTAVVLENGSAFRQIEFAGILKGTKQIGLAQKAMDFILSEQFQSDIPLQMFVFPANNKAIVPDLFKKHAKESTNPSVLDPALINEKRDNWLQEWTEAVL